MEESKENRIAGLQVVIDRLNSYISRLNADAFSSREQIQSLENVIKELEEKLKSQKENKKAQTNLGSLKRKYKRRKIAVILGAIVLGILSIRSFYYLHLNVLNGVTDSISAGTTIGAWAVAAALLAAGGINFLREYKYQISIIENNFATDEEIEETERDLIEKRESKKNLETELQQTDENLDTAQNRLNELVDEQNNLLAEIAPTVELNTYLDETLANNLNNGMNRERLRKGTGDKVI